MKNTQNSIEHVNYLINNPIFVSMVAKKGKEKMAFVIRENFSEFSEDDITAACHIVSSMKDSEKKLSSRKDEIWENIAKKSFGDETPQIENKKIKNFSVVLVNYFRSIGKFKYAIAAVLVGILFGGFLFKDKMFSTSKKSTPIIVKTIEAGSDKAILTLGNGLEVVLDNKASFQTENLVSNGKELVYKNDEQQNIPEVQYNYLTIPRGGQYFVKLSDGTQVWLNSESQLKYPVTFISGKPREVELVYGEAYFDVSPSDKHKGAKFKVYNKVQEIEVLGTEFNIKAYKDETNIYTTLVEGKVVINTSSNQKVLAPNEQSVLNTYNNKIEVSEVDVKNEIAWVKGNFVFQGKTLKEIMQVLSRWYNVSIEFQNKETEDYKFNGQLSKSQDLEEILLLIKETNYINNYKIEDRKIILK